LLGGRHIRFVRGDLEAGMDEAIELVLGGRDYRRMAMPGVQCADAPREVDEPIAVHVRDHRVRA
jgi:hypothetical protein